MSSRDEILTQSQRLLNHRRWGGAYRAGRPAAPAPRPADASTPRTRGVETAYERRTSGIVVIELAERRWPARP